jgi:hypothetical protein
MNVSNRTNVNRDTLLENFAAQLADAVIPLALRRGEGTSWVELELDLWKALTEMVKKSGVEACLVRSR